jgi:uncharacterized protein (TIGR02466 family)
MAMNAEPWFPSVIWNADVQGINNQIIKDYAYQKKELDAGRSISNYGGWQSNNIQPNECDELDTLVKYIDTALNDIAVSVGIKPVTLYNVWININPPGAYNHTHHHQEAIFSGVYYIDADQTQGNINFIRNDGANYHIPADMITQPHHFNSSMTTYPAKTSALYIFPGWLHHSVDGNQSNKDRISISFNCGRKK